MSTRRNRRGSGARTNPMTSTAQTTTRITRSSNYGSGSRGRGHSSLVSPTTIAFNTSSQQVPPPIPGQPDPTQARKELLSLIREEFRTMTQNLQPSYQAPLTEGPPVPGVGQPG